MLNKIKKNALFATSMAGNYLVMLPFFRLFSTRFPSLSGANTDICIEGYPRSGNTYFVSAFLMWNRSVKVAHHSHLASSVKRSLKQGSPTVLLIRKPEDCVASVLAWDGLLSVTVALASYDHFHQQLWKYRQQLLILCFEDVVRYPDECVKLINARFGRDFKCESFDESVDRKIRDRLKKVDGRHQRLTVNSALPNATKLSTKQKYSQRIMSSRRFANANSIYQQFARVALKPANRVLVENNNT